MLRTAKTPGRSTPGSGGRIGAAPGERDKFRTECEATAQMFDREGMAETARKYTIGPTRVQHQNKDPRGWAEFAAQFAEHSAKGQALTMRGRPWRIQKINRPETDAVREFLFRNSPPNH